MDNGVVKESVYGKLWLAPLMSADLFAKLNLTLINQFQKIKLMALARKYHTIPYTSGLVKKQTIMSQSLKYKLNYLVQMGSLLLPFLIQQNARYPT